MPSLMFPDTGTRHVVLPGTGGLAVNARGYLYADEDLTVPAEVYYDLDGTKGALIPVDEQGRRSIVLDAYGRQGNYWGPQDGTARLWIVVNGVASPVDADYKARIDAVVDVVESIDSDASAVADAARDAAVAAASVDATTKASAAQAYAVQRSNHTGTQPHTSVTGLGTAATMNVGTAAGTVAAGNDSRIALVRRNVKDHFGAVGDGTADDTTALQNAINSVGTGGIPTVQLYLPSGTYRITQTLVIYQRAVSMFGMGVGNTTQFAGSIPTFGTTIKWDGPAGQPMIRIRDSRDITFSDIYLQGHDTNTPSEGVYLEGDFGDATGTNQFIRFNRCKFGFNSWRTGGYKMDRCVRVGGPNDANNDQFSFYDCEFGRPVIACVQIDNAQSIWGAFYNCFFNGGDVTAKGLVTTAGTSLYNCAFNACSIDIELNGAPKVAVYGFYSEGSGKLIQVNGRAKMMVKGGQVTAHFVTGDAYIEHANCVGDASLEIESLYVLQNLNPRTKKLRVRGAPGYGMGMVRVSNSHIPPEDYDIVAPTGTSGFVIAVDDSYSGFNAATPRGIFDRTTVTNGGTYVPSNLVPHLTGDNSPEGVVTAPVGSLYRRKNGTAGQVLYVKESGTGTSGWASYVSQERAITSLMPAVAGRYYPIAPGAASTIALTLGSARLAPFWVPAGLAVDELHLSVTTAAAGSIVRFIAYNGSASYPSTLAYDSGTTVTGDSAGQKSVSGLAATLPGGSEGRWYWIGAVMQGAASPTVRITSAGAVMGPRVGDTAFANHDLSTQIGLVTTIADAPPASFLSSQGATGVVPRVIARFV